MSLNDHEYSSTHVVYKIFACRFFFLQNIILSPEWKGGGGELYY